MCDPIKGEIIQAEIEPMNSVDKYAVAAIRGGYAPGHLRKGTSRKCAKILFYFLKCDESNRYWVEVSGKYCNLSNREEMQDLFILHFKGRKVYIDGLKSHLPKLRKYTAKALAKLTLLLRVRING